MATDNIRRFNEGKACDAVIRHIEARTGAVRRDVQSPEKLGHADPVELTCAIGDRLYAIEHTGIEPFAGFVQLQAESERHFAPISAALSGCLPNTEDFKLHIPAKAMQGMSDRAARPVQQAIVNWIKDKACHLPIAKTGRYVTPIVRITIPNVPFSFSLHRAHPYGETGSFKISHLVDGNVEQDRRERVTAGLGKKIKKLDAWKRACGARTVLVLEENDIQLTNEDLVVEAVLRAECDMASKADEVYLVSTSSPLWWLHQMRVDGDTYLDHEMKADVSWKIDPGELDDITGR